MCKEAYRQTVLAVGGALPKQERKIRLSPKILASLKKHKTLQLEERLAFKGFRTRNRYYSEWVDPTLIFPNRCGAVNRRSCVMRAFKRHLEEAGLPNIRLHDLRHTAGTLAILHGERINVVSRMLGHKDPAVTLRRYSHVLAEMEDSAAVRLDSYSF
jgi:integrase